MNNNLINIIKYLENRISIEERKELTVWLSEKKEHQEIFKKEVINWQEKKNDVDFKTNEGLSRFLTSIDLDLNKKHPYSKKGKLTPILQTISYAAILIGIFICFTYYNGHINFFIKDTSIKNNLTLNTTEHIKIVRNDGTVYYADINQDVDITDSSGATIGTKYKNQITFNQVNTINEYSELEISVPKGEILEVILSDGTSVWLNAESTLKFPNRFKDDHKIRLVTLYGEAYFDVTKNTSKPFIVKADNIDITVTGTEFNISNYTEDQTIKTTLVEGSVTVTHQEHKHKATYLTPNEQATFFKKNTNLQKEKLTNITPFIAWKQKRLVIINKSFSEIKKKIERSYNVNIVGNNKKLNQTHFTAEFDSEKIEEILNVFKETVDFNFTLKENTITIYP